MTDAAPAMHPHGRRATEGTRLLRRYLRAHDETPYAFAARVGLSRQLLHWYLTGRGSPKIEHAAELAKATKGAVPHRAWGEPWRGPKPHEWGLGCNDAIAPKPARR